MTAPSEHPIERVIVLGGGPGSAGIAQVMATAGYHTLLCGTGEMLEAARAEVDGGRFGLLAAADAGRISRTERREALQRLTFGDAAAEDFEVADLAVISHAGAPDSLASSLAALEGRLAAGAVLTVDSSGHPLAGVTAGLQRPERVLGWHWGWPAQLNKLAEIVVAEATSRTAVEIVVQVARRCGKNPILIADAPGSWGYVTNRLWAALRGEADRVVAEGVALPEQVDELLMDCFGWPAGPFGRGVEPA